MSVMLGCTGPNPLRSARDRFLTNEPAPVKSALDPSVGAGRPLELSALPAPPMVLDPKLKEDRELQLAEAVEIALRNSDMLRVLSGGDVATGSSSAYDPAIGEAAVVAALAAFDTSFGANFASTRINQPPDSFFGPGLVQPTRRDEMVLNGGFKKQLVTAGEARVTYNPSPGYLFLPLGTSSFFNPQYVGNLEFALRQPLLRGAGTEMARAPVRIVQFKQEQSAWDFKRTIMENLRGVTEAYYDLEAARVAVKAIDEVLPLLSEIVHIQEENLKVEWVIQADVAKALAQLHFYRQQRAQLQSVVLERELRLRNLLRLPPADGLNMIPATPATRAEFVFDPGEALAAAYANHPDVLRQQISLRIREVEWRVAQNGLLPQFDFQALYRMNGVGQNLGDMLQQLSTATYGDWMLGGSFSMPIGRRQARAEMRIAELQLAKERAGMEQVALTAAHRVGDSVRQVHFTYEQYREAAARLKAGEEWLKGSRLRYQNPLPAEGGQNWLLVSLNDYLAALRFRTDAATDAAALLARYNGQLIRLEEAKGTLLHYFDVVLVDDPSGLIRPSKATYHEPVPDASPVPFDSREVEPLPPPREVRPLPQDWEVSLDDISLESPNQAPQELPVPRQVVRRLPELEAEEAASSTPQEWTTAVPTAGPTDAPPQDRPREDSVNIPNDRPGRAAPRIANEPPDFGRRNLAPRVSRPVEVSNDARQESRPRESYAPQRETPQPSKPAKPANDRYQIPTRIEPDKSWTPQMPPVFYVP